MEIGDDHVRVGELDTSLVELHELRGERRTFVKPRLRELDPEIENSSAACTAVRFPKLVELVFECREVNFRLHN